MLQQSSLRKGRRSSSRDKKRVARSKSPDLQVSSVRARFAAHSEPGFAPDITDQENQDAVFIREFPDGRDLLMFGLLDGHGDSGARLTQALSKLLPDMVTCSQSWKEGNYNQALQSTIPAYSAEEQRIRSCKGWIGRCMSDGKPVGPQRMYLPQQDMPGLALTRSIGDFVAAGIGLSSQPDVIQYQVRQQDRYLVLCSDGMIEFMSNRKIISSIHRLAQQGLQPEDIASHLVVEARQKWIKRSPDFIDDCSIIVVLLDNPQHTPRHMTASASELRTTHSILQRALHSRAPSSTPADGPPAGGTADVKLPVSVNLKADTASPPINPLLRRNSLAYSAEPPSPSAQSSNGSSGSSSSRIRSFIPVTLVRKSGAKPFTLWNGSSSPVSKPSQQKRSILSKMFPAFRRKVAPGMIILF
ncbi:hypothetical protein WJX73_004693 [Symbiochloris irregularis]|uniref:PPM-type phosphatase domain-containing protein n=1 Tax=Symbiochloris irregularis TaxID=706552 RepID=A0AAW1PUE5_9CHLO